jgi:hypothetical protein
MRDQHCLGKTMMLNKTLLICYKTHGKYVIDISHAYIYYNLLVSLDLWVNRLGYMMVPMRSSNVIMWMGNYKGDQRVTQKYAVVIGHLKIEIYSYDNEEILSRPTHVLRCSSLSGWTMWLRCYSHEQR